MDIVRLAIVYDTQQAAGNLNQLNGHLTRMQVGQKKAAIAALSLAQAFEAGSISAVGMAKSLGNVAAMIFGPWGIALAVAVGVLTLFMNSAKKAREEQRKLADEMRALTRTVDLLLRPSQKQSDFGAEVQRLTDLIRELDQAIQDSNDSWGTLMQGGLAAALMSLGMGGIGAGLLPKAPAAAGKRRGVQGQLNRLLEPGAEANAELDRYNKLVEQQGRLLAALNAGPFAAMDENISLLREHLEKLGTIEGPEAAAAFERTAASIRTATEALYQMERRFRLMENVLQTMADALEDFVVTGTLAFTDFLNNILRLLLRDATGGVIRSIMGGVGGGGAGTATPGGPEIVSGPGSVNPSVQSTVNFNVQTIDTQSTAQWAERNGGILAGEVVRQLERSTGLRRKVRR